MKYVGIVLLVIVIVGAGVSQTFAALERNLKVGDQGEDVRLLQQFLNKNNATVVASSGPGSAGQETTYFGARTAEALARFQEQFREKILAPLGLSEGTGVLGNLSRALLNELYAGAPSASGGSVGSVLGIGGTYDRWANIDISPEPPALSGPLVGGTTYGGKPFNSGDVAANDIQRSSRIKITAINPEGGSSGVTITITGTGFATSSLGNVVYVGGVRHGNIRSSDGKTMKVTVDAPFGKKPISVADVLTDEEGNSVSVSGDVVTISTKSYGTRTFSPSDVSSLLSRRSMGIPLAVYVEDNVGMISNEKIFMLNP